MIPDAGEIHLVMTRVIPTQMIILDFAGKRVPKIEAEVQGLADNSEKLVEILGRKS